MKKIFSLILSFTFVISAFAADSDWKIHPIFDEEVTHVVETPSYVYFTSRNMMENTTNPTYFSLFRYDKKGEEILPLSVNNILNGYDIRDVIYNPTKGYLAVIYRDYNIDLLHNDGSVTNIPFYEQSNLTYSKHVNSMSVDPNSDRLYLATEFGFVAINDKKYEIAESRIYGEPLHSYAVVGDKVLAVKDNDLLIAEASSPKLSLEEYELAGSFTSPVALYPLSNNTCLLISKDKTSGSIHKLTLQGQKVNAEEIAQGKVYNVENINGGVIVTIDNKLLQFSPEGTYSALILPEGYEGNSCVSSNLSDVWAAVKRKGLTNIKKTGDSWNLARNYMLPGAPSTFASDSFVMHPSEGLLMLSYGYTPVTFELYNLSPMQLSAYKQGRWKNLSPAYTNPDRTTMMTASNGIVVDPDNSDYVYITSFHNGILRLNLKDPQDIIHMSRKEDADNGKPGYVELGPVQNTAKGYWNISAPYFDKWGNLWMCYANWDDPLPKPHYYCWPAADRRATTVNNVKLPQLVEFDLSMPQSNLSLSRPLLKSGNGMHVYTVMENGTHMAVLDTNGTPLDTSDDKIYEFPRFRDSDGNELDLERIRYMWEDPSTGYLWLCHGKGVCYFAPSQVKSDDYTLYRIKVARNDGTNLADYLLDGVTVNQMVEDGAGRKWFATAGGGVICTTSDGRQILEEFNTSNSLLPDDEVYGLAYNSENNSLMFSTTQGYAEYFLPVSNSGSTKTDIRAYPNPVRPDYSGYVTITDIPTGSFVKIADSAGNLVKELGIMSGFEILWDLSDTNFNRVRSGVYHIMVSPSNENSSYSTVGKILVIS